MKVAKVLFTIILVLVVAAAAWAQVPPRPACNVHSAMGAYGYNCTGVAPNPVHNFAVEPFAAYGYVFSNGTGQWRGYGKVSFNGTVLPWTHNTRSVEPAIVNPDCTGSVTYEVTVAGQPVPDAHFEYVIVDNGKEVKGFPVDQGYAVSCQLIRE